MCILCGEDNCGFDDFFDTNPFGIKNMSTTSDYMTSRGYGYETEAKAISEAKKYASKNLEDVKIYKAYKVVNAVVPNIEVTDYTPVTV